MKIAAHKVVAPAASSFAQHHNGDHGIPALPTRSSGIQPVDPTGVGSQRDRNAKTREQKRDCDDDVVSEQSDEKRPGTSEQEAGLDRAGCQDCS